MSGYVWDHEDCPHDDCEGELEQQDEFNVMCLACERVWSHRKDQTHHELVTVDLEVAARKPRDKCGCCGREFGETDRATKTCGGCGAPIELEDQR
jgi:hypothetical protein